MEETLTIQISKSSAVFLSNLLAQVSVSVSDPTAMDTVKAAQEVQQELTKVLEVG